MQEEKLGLIRLMESALAKEIEAENNAGKLMEIFKNNGINLELSSKIHDDEIKHQMMVRNIIDLLNK